jgi:hypothetical protein
MIIYARASAAAGVAWCQNGIFLTPQTRHAAQAASGGLKVLKVSCMKLNRKLAHKSCVASERGRSHRDGPPAARPLALALATKSSESDSDAPRLSAPSPGARPQCPAASAPDSDSDRDGPSPPDSEPRPSKIKSRRRSESRPGWPWCPPTHPSPSSSLPSAAAANHGGTALRTWLRAAVKPP